MSDPDRPGDRDQQQAAEVLHLLNLSGGARDVKEAVIAAAIAAARAEGEAAEAARWRAKIEALLGEVEFVGPHFRPMLDPDRLNGICGECGHQFPCDTNPRPGR